MKIEIVDLDDSMLDEEDFLVERDLNLAAVDAIRRARRFGTFYVIKEGDEIKEIPPDKTAPYEERLLANAARLDARIAELRKSPPSQNTLNDHPKS